MTPSDHAARPTPVQEPPPKPDTGADAVPAARVVTPTDEALAETRTVRRLRRPWWVQRVPEWARLALLSAAIASATGLAALMALRNGFTAREAVLVSLPAGVLMGMATGLVLVLLPARRSAADRRWLARALLDVARVDRDQKFSAILSHQDHELAELAAAIHTALLTAHKDRLEAAHLRRELDARVRRQTKAAVAELTRISHTDELTGLANRRGFETGFDELFKASEAEDEELAVLAVDMDYFKQLNDSAGHEKGDLALRAAGEVIRSQTRTGDIAARVGGDEFLIVLRGTGSAAALAVAKRLIELYARSPHAVAVPARWPGISVGIACAGEHRAQDAAHLKRMADQALYAVKRSGRSKAKIFTPDDAQVPATQAPTAPEQQTALPKSKPARAA